MCFTLFKSF